MSIASATLALPRLFEFGKFRFEVHPMTFEDCAKYANWLMDRARLEVQQLIAQGLDATTLWQAHLESVATCKFEPGGAAFDAAMKTETGYRKMLELMIVGPDSLELSWDVIADDQALEMLSKLVAEVNSDPLAKRARKIPGASKGQGFQSR